MRTDPVQDATVSSRQFNLTNDHIFKHFFFADELYSETQLTGNSLKRWDKNITPQSKVLNERDRSEQYNFTSKGVQISILADVGYNELSDYSVVTQRIKCLCCRDKQISTEFWSWNIKQDVNCRDEETGGLILAK